MVEGKLHIALQTLRNINERTTLATEDMRLNKRQIKYQANTPQNEVSRVYPW
jgi:hypothetical protein